METVPRSRFRKAANILQVALMLSIAMQLLAFFQVRFQLNSPLVPKKIIADLAAPYILSALVSALAGAAAFVFYSYSRYLITVIICSVVLIFQQVVPQLL